MFEKYTRALGNLWNDRTFRIVLVIFLLSKIMIFAAGYLGYFLIPVENSSRKYITENELLNPWAQYDARAYLDIAKNGYNPDFNESGNYGFYPLYPLLIKIFSFIGYDLAALLISNIFSLLAVSLMYVMIRDEFGDKIAKKSTLYLLFFPTAYFFSVMYTESLFLFIVLATFYYARKGNWLAAGVAGFLASLTRIQGILMFLPVIYLYLSSKSFKIKKIDYKILFVFLIPAGVLLFFTYLYYLTGNFFIQTVAFAAQYTKISWPWVSFNFMISNALHATELKTVLYDCFSVFVAAAAFALSLLSFKYVKKDYAIYAIASAILPMLDGNLVSVSRYVLVIFPLFILVPLLESKHPRLSKVMMVVLAVSIIMMLVLTVRHVNMHLDTYGL